MRVPVSPYRWGIQGPKGCVWPTQHHYYVVSSRELFLIFSLRLFSPHQLPSGSLFYQESATSVALLFPLIAWGLFWEAIIKDTAEPQRHNFWIRFTREPSGERMLGQATLVTPYRHPCSGLEPRAMKEFSFLGVFACVLGCSAKPLPTHLYANVSSHTLGMFCPQILNIMHRGWAQLLQKQDLRGGPISLQWSLCRLYPGLEEACPWRWDLARCLAPYIGFPRSQMHLGKKIPSATLQFACMLNPFNRLQLFAVLLTIACQAPPSMGFSRQECWSGLPCSPPGDLLDSGITPTSLCVSCIGRRVLYP